MHCHASLLGRATRVGTEKQAQEHMRELCKTMNGFFARQNGIWLALPKPSMRKHYEPINLKT